MKKCQEGATHPIAMNHPTPPQAHNANTTPAVSSVHSVNELPCSDPDLFGEFQLADGKAATKKEKDTEPLIVQVPRIILCPQAPNRAYHAVKCLGRGLTSVCIQVEDRRGGVCVRHLAMKVIPKDYYKHSLFLTSTIKNEIRLHRFLRHPWIVGFRHASEDAKNVYVFTDLCEGATLHHLLQRQVNKRLSEGRAWEYTRQLLEVLRFMHQKRVLHRDIKIANIFLPQSGKHIQVGDFGFTCRLNTQDQRLTEVLGTPNYSSPELVRISQIRLAWKTKNAELKLLKKANPVGHKGAKEAAAAHYASELAAHSYSTGVDVWAAGVTFFTLLIGTSPFHTKQRAKTDDAILRGVWTPEVAAKARTILRPATARAIRMMLEQEDSKRRSAAALLLHPYFLFSPVRQTSVFRGLVVERHAKQDDKTATTRRRSSFFAMAGGPFQAHQSASAAAPRRPQAHAVQYADATTQRWVEPVIPTHRPLRKR
jgi:serine/threonine protein kinase